MNTYSYGPLIYDKEARNAHCKIDQRLQQMLPVRLTSACKNKMQIDPYLLPCMKLNTKWIKT